MSADRRRAICVGCHQPIDPATALRFCEDACAHEWSALRLHAATPASLWALVEAVRPFLIARAGDLPRQHIAYGNLVECAKHYWPDMHTALQKPNTEWAAKHEEEADERQQLLPGVDVSKEAMK